MAVKLVLMAFSPVPSFVKSLETVTVIREIIIEWKSFLVLYNYNLKNISPHQIGFGDATH